MAAALLLAGVQGPTTELTGTSTFNRWQYELILYALVVAFFALGASGVFAVTTRQEISKKYRASSVASTLITWVAAIAYLFLIGIWLTHWHTTDATGSQYAPKPGTIFTGLRYADWSVTVPLLTVELLAVCNTARGKSVGLRFASMGSAFLMIVTGFFGVVSVGQNNASTTELVVWGVISTVFFIALYPLLLKPVLSTMKEINPEAATSLRNAAVLLLSVWGVYPLVYLIPWWAGDHSAGWATTAQLAFTAADIVAKAGFGALIHKVAKLRTAEDTAKEPRAADVPDIFPAEVYIAGNLYTLPPRAMASVGAAAGNGSPAADGFGADGHGSDGYGAPVRPRSPGDRPSSR
jgi:bacteriorhodopsin